MTTKSALFVALAITAALAQNSCLRWGEVSARFDNRAPAEVTAKTVTGRSGETVTLVRAAINGGEDGWFVLASGSYYTIVDPKFVSRFDDFPKFSEIEIPYPCKLPVAVHRAKALTVGRLTIRNTDIAVFDLSGVLGDFDEEIVGMLGYPVFQHSVVKIEYGGSGGADCVFVYDPGSFELETGDWRPLAVIAYQPVLQARVNRKTSAPFVIDTGFGGNVSFYSVFATNHDVLEGRPTSERNTKTVCGDAVVLDSSVRVFEIGGEVYDDLAVSVTTPGSIYDVGTGRMGGVIGRDYLRRFDVIFDCTRQRIALLDL
jgi:hypothetical protein